LRKLAAFLRRLAKCAQTDSQNAQLFPTYCQFIAGDGQKMERSRVDAEALSAQSLGFKLKTGATYHA
jgi:hypothetical protein